MKLGINFKPVDKRECVFFIYVGVALIAHSVMSILTIYGFIDVSSVNEYLLCIVAGFALSISAIFKFRKLSHETI